MAFRQRRTCVKNWFDALTNLPAGKQGPKRGGGLNLGIRAGFAPTVHKTKPYLFLLRRKPLGLRAVIGGVLVEVTVSSGEAVKV
jgi:hypothetical protein